MRLRDRLAEIFFKEALAPIKRVALIGDAGHFAAFMQPDQFLCEPLVRRSDRKWNGS